MIRQQAFEDTGRKMLKGALHCHTTRSDGQLTPEELLQKYYEFGYNFAALTDHRIYNYKNFRPDLPITVIPGMEADIQFYVHTGPDGVQTGCRYYHTVFLGPEKEKGNGFEQDERVEVPESVITTEFGPQESTAKEYQRFLDEAHAKNNLTFYCHPEWSCTPVRYFENQQGNFAMEIRNSHAALYFDVDTDASYWDNMLMKGKAIYGVAVDDTHFLKTLGHAWVMVNAENNVSSILDALKNGAFYSSCGPEIYDFYWDPEEKKAVVECSPAAKVCFYRAWGPSKLLTCETQDMTRAEIKLGSPGYIRVTVIDKDGNHAWSNPIFSGQPWENADN